MNEWTLLIVTRPINLYMCNIRNISSLSHLTVRLCIFPSLSNLTVRLCIFPSLSNLTVRLCIFPSLSHLTVRLCIFPSLSLLHKSGFENGKGSSFNNEMCTSKVGFLIGISVRGIARNSSRIARSLQGSQLRGTKIHLRLKPYSKQKQPLYGAIIACKVCKFL